VFAFGNQLWGATEDYVLLSIPLYILLGEVLVRAGATGRCTARWPTGSTSCPAASCIPTSAHRHCSRRCPGSSVATAATISTIALPTFKSRNYDQRMVLGSIAAGASLGNLIPPGIAFLVYGAMTSTSAGNGMRLA
jgi:TRAP-type C4-dicarboxylate transport system permease large subunit